MHLDELPVELLLKIFDNLTAYEQISLVNRRFYNVARKSYDSNICLRLDQMFCERFLCDGVPNIPTSNRQITEVKIETFVHFERQIVDVVKRFSATIKCLSVDAVLDRASFLEILASATNVQDLNLRDLRFDTDNDARPRRRYCCCCTVNLKDLKSLSICKLPKDLSVVFNGLPVGVLQEFRVSDFRRDALTYVLSRQANIKKLYLGGIRYENIATDIFDHLTLDSLELDVHVTRNPINSPAITAVILSKQPKLKSLTLSYGTVVDDRVMNAVANLNELEVLEMDVAATPAASFAYIRRLKMMTKLTLHLGRSGCRAKLKVLIESANHSLTSLTLNGNFKKSVNLLGALAKSVPHLTHFTYFPLDTWDDAELDEILTHFNFVAFLSLSILRKPPPYRRQHYNPKLRSLSLMIFDSEYYEAWLTKIMANYPNLRRLHLSVRGSRSILLRIRPIVDGLPKLESLTLCAHANELFVVDLHQYWNHRVNFIFKPTGTVKRVPTLCNRSTTVVILILIGFAFVALVSFFLN